MSLSFERFGGAWHPFWHAKRSTPHPQLTAEPRTTTTCGTAFSLIFNLCGVGEEKWTSSLSVS